MIPIILKHIITFCKSSIIIVPTSSRNHACFSEVFIRAERSGWAFASSYIPDRSMYYTDTSFF